MPWNGGFAYNQPIMSKNLSSDQWIQFLSSRLKSQISIENAEKLQTWAMAIIGMTALGLALKGISSFTSLPPVFAVKTQFIAFFHGVMVFGFYLPAFLQKGEKIQARLLGIRDQTNLTLLGLVFAFYAFVIFMVSQQAAVQVSNLKVSGYFAFITSTNFVVSAFYLAVCAFLALGFFFMPNLLIKLADKSGKLPHVLFGVHAVLFFLTGAAYGEIAAIGSARFFEHLLISAEFWIFILASVFFIARLLGESQVAPLAALEFEVTSGKLERHEDILARFRDVFIRRRLSFWINRLSHLVAARAHEIASYTHDAVKYVDRDQPTEIDLTQVEGRYKKADSLQRAFERESQRFQLCLSFFDFNEAERERIEKLRDQFSRELRNTKLELASVRKRIDDKLVAIKNNQVTLIADDVSPQKPAELPLSN